MTMLWICQGVFTILRFAEANSDMLPYGNEKKNKCNQLTEKEYDIQRGLIISMKNNKFLILGGDSRSLYLGEFLEKQGLNVCYYAFNDVDCFTSLGKAFCESNCIILPLPFTKDKITLNTPLFDETVAISDICTLATPEKIFFGGQLPKSFQECLQSKSVKYTDYFLLDELAVYNAVPTAEGTIGILIDKLPVTVHEMNCGIVGYGKVGKAVSKALKALGANVTVFARKEKDLADAFSNSLKGKYITDLVFESHKFHALINTVPVKIIGEKELRRLNPDCLLVELASSPFGIDFQKAKELAFEVIKASSLPGKVAPKTAGEIIGRSILPIIRARGLTD